MNYEHFLAYCKIWHGMMAWYVVWYETPNHTTYHPKRPYHNNYLPVLLITIYSDVIAMQYAAIFKKRFYLNKIKIVLFCHNDH